MKKLRLLFLAIATLCFIGFYGCKGAAEKAEGEEVEVVEEAVEVTEEAVDTTEAAEETPADTVEAVPEEE